MAGTKSVTRRRPPSAASGSTATPPGSKTGKRAKPTTGSNPTAGKPGRTSRRDRKAGAKASGPATAAPRRRPERPEWPHDGTRGLFAPADTMRPHVRLGALWFLLVTVSLAGGPLGLVVPYGGAAALGAAQTARAWQRAGRKANVAVAAAVAALIPLSAAYATWGPGAAILVGVAVSVAVAQGDTRAILADGGATIRSWLFLGIAAGSVVVMAGMDLGAALALILLTSVYDCGNYVVGADSRWPALGIAAGAAGVGVMTFSLFVVALPPFGGPGIVPFGLATIVLAPLGQVAGAYVLPDGRALASGLRRLDSVLLVAPAWLAMFALVPPG